MVRLRCHDRLAKEQVELGNSTNMDRESTFWRVEVASHVIGATTSRTSTVLKVISLIFLQPLREMRLQKWR